MSSVPGIYPTWGRTVLVVSLLAVFAVQTPGPWAALWIAVPLSAALALLAGWRFGIRGAVVPVGLFAGAMALGGPQSLWVWWPPVAALSGLWMGLREEGGGPTAGERAWMLLPVLVFSAWMPWAPPYAGFAAGVERELTRADAQLVELARQTGSSGERLATVERAVTENARLRRQALPSLLPTVLFVWVVLLVGAGRTLAARAAGSLGWPPLSAPNSRPGDCPTPRSGCFSWASESWSRNGTPERRPPGLCCSTAGSAIVSRASRSSRPCCWPEDFHLP